MEKGKTQSRYFAVKTKNGHTGLGKGYYIPIVYVVMALTASAAAQQARQIPRVKHHKSDAILEVKEIGLQERQEIIMTNREDPFLQSKNIQEQRSRISYDELLDRVVPEIIIEKRIGKKDPKGKSRIYRGKILLRKPNRYCRYSYDSCRLSRVTTS